MNQEVADKQLGKVYELLLGKKVMNAIAGLANHDQDLALAVMSVALEISFGSIPRESGQQQIDDLISSYLLDNGGSH